MDYMTTKQAAEKWQISDRRVLQFCNAGHIEGAEKMGNIWLIPKDAKKPIDGSRYKILDDSIRVNSSVHVQRSERKRN